VKKIIHLSDLHIGHDDCSARFYTIIDNISVSMKPARDYVIVITGDIVDNANRKGLAGEAVKAIDLLKARGYKVLVVPGNHDYGTGTIGDQKFVLQFKRNFFGTGRITYPRLDIIGKVAFIGLDSMAEELHWYDRFLSQGQLGERQLKRLKRILDMPDVKTRKKVVYLHHHPFDFLPGMQLKDSDRLKDIIENRIDMLLYGHYHTDPDTVGRSRNGEWGIKRCYNAGTSTHKNDNIGLHRVIDLSNRDPGNDYDGAFL
jgi:predicted MPP superfamily phosphohydrolase